MEQLTRPRVVVGIDESLAGLRALRFAVAETRRRNAELHAVRAWTFNGTARSAYIMVDEHRRAAAAMIEDAFGEAMGRMPDDIEVLMTTVVGSPGRSLVKYADLDTDLLVLGATGGSRLVRLLRRSVPRYCAARAVCPVLVVPPSAFARQAQRAGMARALRRDLPQLTT
jgi:nucleotide-binding universal stress UspA family protein